MLWKGAVGPAFLGTIAWIQGVSPRGARPGAGCALGAETVRVGDPAESHPEAVFPGCAWRRAVVMQGYLGWLTCPFPLKKMKETSIDDLMKSLDKNSDQEIDFKEYSVFLTTLCMAYNDFFLEDRK